MVLRLRRILAAEGIDATHCAKFLRMSPRSLSNKIRKETEFTYGESLRLKKLLPKYDIDYLLSDDLESDVAKVSA